MSDPAVIVCLAQLLVLVVFTNRYVFGRFLREAKGGAFDETTDDYEPDVTIVIPMFNEGAGIYDTVKSLLMQDYPESKLRVMVIDDCSTDDSHAWATRAASESDRVTVMRNPTNMGKRRGINRAVRAATSEIIVSVDSDVVVASNAVRELVRRFVAPEIAAVGGRVFVSNHGTNWLTRMQAIKYYFGYEYAKNVERAHRTVMCLSGCLTAYRRHVLLELEPILENREVLGVAIKYGEDRFLTRQIVKAGYRTVLTLDAISYTVAPDTMTKYFAQQLRWRRSNLIDYLGGITHVYRVHPAVSTHYVAMFALTTLYPVLVATELARGEFFASTALHLGVLSVMASMYWLESRRMPADQRVEPVYFLAMAFVMPVTYVLLTPLALFTLDSGSWETRNHTATRPLDESEAA